MMAVLFIPHLLFLFSALLHQQSEAISQVDANHVLLAYHQGFDNCKDITDLSSDASKSAANEACEQAFDALDRLYLNTCKGWRRAKCRLISGQKQRQCSCTMPFYDDKSIRNDIVKPFRECATTLWDHHERTGVAPAPTTDFQQRRSTYGEALLDAQMRRYSSHSDPFSGAGSSSGAFVTNAGKGHSRGVKRQRHDASQNLPGASPKKRPFRPHQCSLCPRSYTTLNNLIEHVKSHTTEATKCRPCNRTFTTKGSLNLHIKKMHAGVPGSERVRRDKRPMKERNPGPFFCGVCGKAYVSLSTLRDHEISHTTLNTHCFECKITFASKQSYKVHLKNAHPEDALAEEEAERKLYEEENPEVCDVCHKRFKNPTGLKQHKYYHEGKTTCDKCGAVFQQMTSLYNHKARVHRNPK